VSIGRVDDPMEIATDLGQRIPWVPSARDFAACGHNRVLLMSEPPNLIEEARNHFHPKSHVDRAIETGVLRRLRQAWAGAPPSLENDDLP